jgi:hypothetical protein
MCKGRGRKFLFPYNAAPLPLSPKNPKTKNLDLLRQKKKKNTEGISPGVAAQQLPNLLTLMP